MDQDTVEAESEAIAFWLADQPPEVEAAFDATMSDDTDRAESIIASDRDPLRFGSVLWAAVKRKNLQLLATMLPYGYTSSSLFILEAIHQKSIPIFQLFLDNGWDINEPISRIVPPPLAYVLDDLDVAKWFLDNGADPNKTCGFDMTPMSAAIARAPFTTIELLFSRGGNVKSGQLLHHAVTRNADEVLKVLALLLDHGAPINELMYQHHPPSWMERWRMGMGTPLHRAAYQGRVEAATFLLSRGANPFVLDSLGRTALELAELGGHTRIATLLDLHMKSIPRGML